MVLRYGVARQQTAGRFGCRGIARHVTAACFSFGSKVQLSSCKAAVLAVKVLLLVVCRRRTPGPAHRPARRIPVRERERRQAPPARPRDLRPCLRACGRKRPTTTKRFEEKISGRERVKSKNACMYVCMYVDMAKQGDVPRVALSCWRMCIAATGAALGTVKSERHPRSHHLKSSSRKKAERKCLVIR